MKKCSKCREEKQEADFYVNRATGDGLNYSCRECAAGSRSARAEDIRRYKREYYMANTEDIRRYKREYYMANASRILARCRAFTAEHRQQNNLRDRLRERDRPNAAERCLWVGARDRAKRQGVPFGIPSYRDIVIPEFCPVLGIRLKRNVKHPGPDSPTIDKHIPAMGYVPGNWAVISFRANAIKRDATSEELMAIAKWATTLVTNCAHPAPVIPDSMA